VGSQARDEKLEMLACNGLRITLNASVPYRITDAQVVALAATIIPS
jgi:hypothetical protein